jgi:hypothetical protein
MTDLMEVYDRHASRLGLKMELYHSNIVDWRIIIKKPNGEFIVDVQHCDYKYVLAKAEVDLKNWLSEYNDGY